MLMRFQMDKIQKAFLLKLQNRQGTQGCYIENTMKPPYKTPALPFDGINPIVHDLLQSLKAAHTTMAQQLVMLQGFVPVGCLGIREVYKPELDYPDMVESSDYIDIGRRYFSDGAKHPFLVEGFCISDNLSRCFCYSFDLSPYKLLNTKHFSEIGMDADHLMTLEYASLFYNECVSKLFDIGIILNHPKFSDALAFAYPALPLPVKPLFI